MINRGTGDLSRSPAMIHVEHPAGRKNGGAGEQVRHNGGSGAVVIPAVGDRSYHHDDLEQQRDDR
jgi:hypothetical protein